MTVSRVTTYVWPGQPQGMGGVLLCTHARNNRAWVGCCAARNLLTSLPFLRTVMAYHAYKQPALVLEFGTATDNIRARVMPLCKSPYHCEATHAHFFDSQVDMLEMTMVAALGPGKPALVSAPYDNAVNPVAVLQRVVDCFALTCKTEQHFACVSLAALERLINRNIQHTDASQCDLFLVALAAVKLIDPIALKLDDNSLACAGFRAGWMTATADYNRAEDAFVFSQDTRTWHLTRARAWCMGTPEEVHTIASEGNDHDLLMDALATVTDLDPGSVAHPTYLQSIGPALRSAIPTLPPSYIHLIAQYLVVHPFDELLTDTMRMLQDLHGQVQLDSPPPSYYSLHRTTPCTFESTFFAGLLKRGCALHKLRSAVLYKRSGENRARNRRGPKLLGFRMPTPFSVVEAFHQRGLQYVQAMVAMPLSPEHRNPGEASHLHGIHRTPDINWSRQSEYIHGDLLHDPRHGSNQPPLNGPHLCRVCWTPSGGTAYFCTICPNLILCEACQTSPKSSGLPAGRPIVYRSGHRRAHHMLSFTVPADAYAEDVSSIEPGSPSAESLGGLSTESLPPCPCRSHGSLSPASPNRSRSRSPAAPPAASAIRCRSLSPPVAPAASAIRSRSRSPATPPAASSIRSRSLSPPAAPAASGNPAPPAAPGGMLLRSAIHARPSVLVGGSLVSSGRCRSRSRSPSCEPFAY